MPCCHKFPSCLLPFRWSRKLQHHGWMVLPVRIHFRMTWLSAYLLWILLLTQCKLELDTGWGRIYLCRPSSCQRNILAQMHRQILGVQSLQKAVMKQPQDLDYLASVVRFIPIQAQKTATGIFLHSFKKRHFSCELEFSESLKEDRSVLIST